MCLIYHLNHSRDVFPPYTLAQLTLADSFACAKFGKRSVVNYLGYCIGDPYSSRIPGTFYIERRANLQRVHKSN